MPYDILKCPLCCETPLRLTDITSWHGHIPFAFAMVHMLRPKVIVELGTHKGDSYSAFCQAVQTLNLECACYAVDNWEGDDHAGFYDREIFDEFRHYHDPLYAHFSTLLKMTFDEALERFADRLMDLLHIDGLHSYDAVAHDFRSWVPRMSRKGVVLLHDTRVRKGVWRLWEEVSQEYPSFEFTHGNGLGVLGVGEMIPDDVAAFFNLGEGERDQVRLFFSALGDKVRQTRRVREGDARIAELEKQIVSLTSGAESDDKTGSWKLEIEDYYPHPIRRRYGGFMPPHEKMEAILAQGVERYERLMRQFAPFTDQLLSIKKLPDAERSEEPHWMNGFFPPLDAVALFSLISFKQPTRYMEIGSGHSTRFAAKAVRLNSPSTRVISIDPCPRSDIDSLCDQVIRTPLEACDVTLFDELTENDILFFDGSHRVLQNSDTTVLFLDVIPRLKPGVCIHLHDISWPLDYPEEWVGRLYSEQYILGALLLYANDKLEILLPNAFISWQTDLNRLYHRLWDAPHLQGIERHGSSFWFRLCDTA